ncbi:MAG: FtsX-like permease family protein [Atopobiaceae bacterium]|nr:FtsX-like permease family protein [Atopobiaceae bacterium]
MLARLSLANIRRSLRDYAIYFCTLVIGVAVFYVFNAVSSQAAALPLTAGGSHVAKVLGDALAAISLFVAAVLGLLIVYASRFLMKRRNREFALYLLLGMSKRQVSTILLVETLIIGIGSLGVGLVVGVLLSQLMSGLVASLFDASMGAYRFTVSHDAITKAVRNFAIMYAIVMLLNRRAVARMKLIDLMQSERRSEQVRLKNPVLCVVVFVIGVALLALAYIAVTLEPLAITGAALTIHIIIGIIGTFLVFWSVSGLFLRIVMSMRDVYYRDLNCFTFRQVSSKINTVVFSMTVICIMLFFTICMLSSAFALRNGMYANFRDRCPADFEVRHAPIAMGSEEHVAYDDVVERYARYGFDVRAPLADCVHFHTYSDPSLSFVGGRSAASGMAPEAYGSGGDTEIIRVSDYNALRALFGREQLELGEGEFAIICDFDKGRAFYDRMLKDGSQLEVFGRTLSSRYRQSQDGFVDLSSMRSNAGIVVVPDDAVDEAGASIDRVIGNYAVQDGGQRQGIEEQCRAERDAVEGQMDAEADAGTLQGSYFIRLITKDQIVSESITSGALMTFVCLYIGLVFLVASGAILALRALTDSVDSVSRYETLRKIGVDDRDIDRSLLIQTGLFFLLPLLVACVHAVFGMRFMMAFITLVGVESVFGSIALTVLIILLVYGGYFVATLAGSKRIIEAGVRSA